MNKIVTKASITLLAVFLVGCLSSTLVYGQVDANAKLQAANDAVNEAFVAAVDAEQAGANVTGLLSQLNVAVGLFTDAENQYRSGDFEAGSSSADNAVLMARQAKLDAQIIKESTQAALQNAFLLNLVLVVSGSIILVVVLMIVWVYVKHRYVRNLAQSVPEVVDDEA